MPDPIAILLSVLMLVWLVLYVRGWLRLRRRGAAQLASVYRLLVFLTATTLVGLVLLSPVSWLNSQYLFMRSLQTVVLCLLAAPAFHLACGYDILLWGLPDGGRRWLRHSVQPGTAWGEWGRRATPMAWVWLAFLGVFLVWHEPNVVNWLIQYPMLHTGVLVLLGLLALARAAQPGRARVRGGQRGRELAHVVCRCVTDHRALALRVANEPALDADLQHARAGREALRSRREGEPRAELHAANIQQSHAT